MYGSLAAHLLSLSEKVHRKYHMPAMPLLRTDSGIRTPNYNGANRDGLSDILVGVQEPVNIQLFLMEMLARCSLRAVYVNCRRSRQVYARECRATGT
jgi:hypothetical protein